MLIRIWGLLFLSLPVLLAQQPPSTGADSVLQSVLRRLDALEAQNRSLEAEVQSLRQQLVAGNAASDAPPLEDRLAVAERRIEEQDQSKVEAFQKFPIHLQGMLLFNAFANSRGSDVPPGVVDGPNRMGATFGQTLIGFAFHGPDLPGGGKASGELNLDFGARGAGVYGSSLEFRRAVINLDWKRRSVTFGQDKPLISQRDPDSLAEVVTPALSNAGNPWVWTPQVRYEERVAAGESSGFKLQAAVVQTVENAGYLPETTYNLELARPAFEGRVEYWRAWGESGRIEVAPGFHVSSSHLDYASVPSHFASLDWKIAPSHWVDFTGLVLGGRNLGNLGGVSIGSTNVGPEGEYVSQRAVGALAGWAQIAVHITPRLTFNTFAGSQALKKEDLGPGLLTHNFAYAGNFIYRIAPNILLGAEALQERAGYLGEPRTVRNHFDLSVGYLF